MKYVGYTKYFPNCRAHDGGFFSELVFFKSLKEAFAHMSKNMDREQLMVLHSTKGKILFKPVYELSGHGCSGIIVNLKGHKFRTVDDGHGNTVWENV